MMSGVPKSNGDGAVLVAGPTEASLPVVPPEPVADEGLDAGAGTERGASRRD